MSSIIRCRDLSKHYGAKQALTNVSFELQAGEPIALVGPNGAGKTTLFSILCGYLHPSSGSVVLLNNRPGSSELFGKVSALPQDAQLDSAFTIHQQFVHYARLQGFSRKKARLESARALEMMQLSDALDYLPSKLSHGMRKRAAIAQALMGNPEIVFLDEPTAGLDPVNARNIREQISTLSDRTTFVISSHNLQELERLCQTVLYLENGCLLRQTQVKAPTDVGYITIVVDIQAGHPSIDQMITAMKALKGVSSVINRNKNEFILQYDQNDTPHLDQALLKCLSTNGWTYRQLTRGKSLEDQLFSTKTSNR